MIARHIKKLLTQPPTSHNRSKAIRYLTQHLGTPYTADLKVFASSHYPQPQICNAPHWSPTHPACEFQSTALADYKLCAHALMRHRRCDMELGSCFVRYAHYTEATLLQQFCQRVRQIYGDLHTSIATLRRCIIAWMRQGTSLLAYCDTLLETGHAKKAKLWTQSLRTLRHRSTKALTQVAALLLRQNWSTTEDLFRAAAATVHHLKKRLQPCDPGNPNQKGPTSPALPRTPDARAMVMV